MDENFMSKSVGKEEKKLLLNEDQNFTVKSAAKAAPREQSSMRALLRLKEKPAWKKQATAEDKK
jgi:hypothetical protein